VAHDEVGKNHELLAGESAGFVGGVLLQQPLADLGSIDALVL